MSLPIHYTATYLQEMSDEAVSDHFAPTMRYYVLLLKAVEWPMHWKRATLSKVLQLYESSLVRHGLIWTHLVSVGPVTQSLSLSLSLPKIGRLLGWAGLGAGLVCGFVGACVCGSLSGSCG